MNLSRYIKATNQSELDAPPSTFLPVYRVLFLVYLCSFVFDYKATDISFGSSQTGGSPFQFLFMGLAMLAGGLGSFIGCRHLLTRPGVYLIIFWWAYVAYSGGVAFASGNPGGTILRLMVPSILVGLGANLTMICACAGMRPAEAARWFVMAGLINVIWKLLYGSVITGVPLSEVRMGILSPAMRFLFAWSACALLLRQRFTPAVVIVFAIPLTTAVLSITRSIAFPIAASFSMAALCILLGILWGMYDWKHAFKKTGILGGFGFTALVVVAVAILALPDVADRWSQRLFDNKGEGGATTEDLSTLMRKAEAKSMWDLLAQEPHKFIYGKGLGAAYYWDEDYYPELFLVYPNDRHQFPHNIRTAGHSVWTYTLFSRGWIGVTVMCLAFFIPMGMSLYSAYKNSRTVMGPRAWDTYLIFFPFVGMWAVLSESITRNPFDERFTGVLFGFLLLFPQFFFNRAYYLKYREDMSERANRVVFDEDNNPPAAPAYPGNLQPHPNT